MTDTLRMCVRCEMVWGRPQPVCDHCKAFFDPDD